MLVLWLYSQAGNGYIYALLSFSMFSDESNLSAASHRDTFNEVLQFYERSFSKVSCIIGDSFSKNSCLTHITDCYVLDCSSHRLYIDIKSILEKYNNVFCMI